MIVGWAILATAEGPSPKALGWRASVASTKNLREWSRKFLQLESLAVVDDVSLKRVAGAVLNERNLETSVAGNNVSSRQEQRTITEGQGRSGKGDASVTRLSWRNDCEDGKCEL